MQWGIWKSARHFVRMWLLGIARGVPIEHIELIKIQVARDIAAGGGRSSGESGPAQLSLYRWSIDAFNAGQPNEAQLEEIRAYNHQIVGELASIRSLAELDLLDIGASPHGYALEACVALGAASYTGIGLDIERDVALQLDGVPARLILMNAEQLAFEDDSFDVVLSMSTFEHIGDVPRALSEIRRVLRPHGVVLLSFEPVWTCSYGHHLHQWPALSALVEPWSHLVLDRAEMRASLASNWPEDAAIDLDSAINWIYDSTVINRVPIDKMRDHLNSCGLDVEWILSMPGENRNEEALQKAMHATGLSADDLRSRGLSVLMRYPQQQTAR